MLVVALVAAIWAGATWSAFSSTTADAGNTLASGTVTLTDNDAGSTVFSLASLKPGDTESRCVTVTYTGSVDALVRLYGATTGTGLDAYLDLTVARGSSGASSPGDCTGFSADSLDYLGAGAGVVYSGTLQGFPDAYAAGLVDPVPGAAESWVTGESHAYRLTLAVQDNNSAQGLNMTQEFTWEARNTMACGRYTPVALTGMEHGVLATTSGSGMFDGSSSAGGAPAVDATVARSGTYSLRIPKTNTGGSSVINNVNVPTVVRRFAIRLATLPVASVNQFARITALAGNGASFGYDQPSGKFRMVLGASTALGSTTVTAGTWYVIDWRYSPGVNPRTSEWRVNGVDQTTASSAEATANADVVRTGSADTVNDVFTANYDDMVLSTTSADYPIGDGRVLSLAPDSTGAGNDPGARMKNDDDTAVGASSWQRVDEAPMSATADYVKQISADAATYAELGFADTSQTCINAVSAVVASHSSSTTANSARTAVVDGSTERVVYSGDMSPGASLEYHAAVVAPADRLTGAVLNGLKARVGYATSVASVPSWDSLRLEYDIGL